MQAVSTTRPCTKRFKETIIIVTLGTIWPSGLGGLSHRGDPSLGTILVMGIFILLHQFPKMYLVPNFKKEVVKNVYKSKDQNGNFGIVDKILEDIRYRQQIDEREHVGNPLYIFRSGCRKFQTRG